MYVVEPRIKRAQFPTANQDRPYYTTRQHSKMYVQVYTDCTTRKHSSG
jgi:hypothetical protein